jgi:hypothetical protein
MLWQLFWAISTIFRSQIAVFLKIIPHGSSIFGVEMILALPNHKYHLSLLCAVQHIIVSSQAQFSKQLQNLRHYNKTEISKYFT